MNEDQRLREADWAEIDDFIFGNKIVRALKAIRAKADVSLHDAMSMHAERYTLLRQRDPDRFTCSHEEYWRDVYS